MLRSKRNWFTQSAESKQMHTGGDAMIYGDRRWDWEGQMQWSDDSLSTSAMRG